MRACEDNEYQTLFSGHAREPGHEERVCSSLEVLDGLPKDMRYGLDQLDQTEFESRCSCLSKMAGL